MNKRNLQAGFTLIEIVMVLVLLGILAAVAAPKYFDLQATAKEKAAAAAVAEAQARLNAEFAQKILAGSKCGNASIAALTSPLTMGEWKVSWTAPSEAPTTDDAAKVAITSVEMGTGDGEAFTASYTATKSYYLYYPVCSSSNN